MEPVAPTNNETPANQLLMGMMGGDLWSSPAFLKRARTSYGSMFESDFDPFAEEDGSVRGKGRKKARLSSTNWRYTSRSPSAEVEEREMEPLDTAPEPSPQTAPTMTDEACQTVDLGETNTNEDMARTLAEFSRQVTNVGSVPYSMPSSSVFSGQTQMQLDNSLQPSLADLPHPPVVRSEDLDQDAGEPSIEHEMPDSPRLLPVPSESLSLVSPLFSTKYGHFQPNEEPPVNENHQVSTGDPRTSVVNSTLSTDVMPEEEDIYSASPARQRQQEPAIELQNFGNSLADTGSTRNAVSENPQNASEEQYGQWQSIGARISQPAPPRNEVLAEANHFHDNLENFQEADNGLVEQVTDIPHSEYPPLGDDFSGQVSSGWGVSSIIYPDLPDPESSGYPPPPPAVSSAMSHSESGRSAVSPVVDLIESDDESPSVASSEYSEDKMGVSAEEEEEDGVVSEQRRAFPDNGHDQSEEDDKVEESDEQDSARDEEGGYEDGMEEDGTDGYDSVEESIQQQKNARHWSSSEEDEEFETYDENELQRPPPVRPSEGPEVIDLLSSDDESETPETPMPTSKRATPDQLQLSADSRCLDAESEEGDVEQSDAEDPNEDAKVPYAERSEIETSFPVSNVGVQESEEEEGEKSIVEEEDQEDEEGQDAIYDEEHNAAAKDDGREVEVEQDEEPTETMEEDQDRGVDPEENDGIEPVHKDPNSEAELEAGAWQHHAAEAQLLSKRSERDSGEDGGDVPEPNLLAHADKQDSNHDCSDVRTPEAAELANVAEVQIPANAVDEIASPPRISPGRPTVFHRMFPSSTDGQNDEPLFGASYSSLSVTQPPLHSSMFSGTALHSSDNQALDQNDVQLPTPEDTQISNRMTSTEVSFSTMTEHQQAREMWQDDDEMVMEQTEEVPNENEVATSTSLSADATSMISEPDVVQEESIDIEEVVTSTIIFEEQDRVAIDLEGEFDSTDEMQLVPTERVESPKVEEVSHNLEIEESREVTEDEIKETVVITETTSMIIEEPFVTVEHADFESYDGGADSRPEEVCDERIGVEESGFTQDRPRRSTRSAKPTSKSAVNTKENIRPASPVKAALTKEPITSVTPSKPATKPLANTKENISPVTPAKPRVPPASSDVNELSPIVLIQAPATPKGHDASIEFAVEAVEAVDSLSPSYNLRRSHVTAPEGTDTSPTKQRLRNQHSATLESTKTSPPPPNYLRKSLAGSEAIGSSPPPHNLRSHMVVTESLPTPQYNLRNAHLDTSKVASSSPPQHDRNSGAELKLRLAQALRTELSEFTALKVLRYQLNKKSDVLAVATTTPPEPRRAKGGPRHYKITFNVTDPSTAPSGVTEVQVFRPYKDALPIIETGDVILLRNFQVIASTNRGFALRSQEEASSWAVFKKENDEVDVRGPPVEYGDGEKAHVEQLKTWYKSFDEIAMAKIARANGDKSAVSAAGKH